MAWDQLDEALEMVSAFGLWQARTFLLLTLTCGLAIAWHMFSHVFTAAYTPYHCDVPINYDKNETLDMYLPRVCDDSDTCYLDVCTMFSNYTGNSTGNVTVIGCVNGFYFYGPMKTIVSQWDLVCGEELRESTVYSLLGGGLLVGALVFTTISDFLGRKNVCLSAMVMLGAVGLGQAFIPNYIAYCVFQFMRGMAVQGVFLCGVVLFTEMLPPSQRVLAGVAAQVAIAIGMMTLTGIAYGLTNHQHLTACISAPFLLAYFMYWVIPESIPWLVLANRLTEAEHLVRTMFKENKVELPEYLLESLRKANDPPEPLPVEEKKEASIASEPESLDYRHAADISFIQALRSKTVVLYLGVLIIYWFTMPLVYYGMTLSAGSLSGDIYLNFFLLSVVELPSALVCLFLLPRFGRKKTLFISHSISSACLLVITLEKFVTHDVDLNILEIVLSMLTKFGSGSAFLIGMFYTPELFPTPIRNFATGLTASVGTLTNIVVPFVLQTYEVAQWLPALIFLICMVVSGLLVIVLPETMGRPLPQTIADLESWSDGCCGESKGTRFIYDMNELVIDGDSNDGYEPDKTDRSHTDNKAGFYEEHLINGGPNASPIPSNTRL